MNLVWQSLLLLCCCLSGWFSVYSGNLKAQPWQVRKIGKKEGLPSGGVHWIVPDAQGFLWLLSDRGLLKWDGNRFEEFMMPGSPSGMKFKFGFIPQYISGELWIHNYTAYYKVNQLGKLIPGKVSNCVLPVLGPGIPLENSTRFSDSTAESILDRFFQDLRKCRSFQLPDSSFVLTDGMHCLNFKNNLVEDISPPDGSSIDVDVSGKHIRLSADGRIFMREKGKFIILERRHPWHWDRNCKPPEFIYHFQSERNATYALGNRQLLKFKLIDRSLLIDTLYSGTEPNANFFWINPENEHLYLCSRHDGLLIYSPVYFRTENREGYAGSGVVYNFAHHPNIGRIITNQDLHVLLHPGAQWQWGEINAMLNLSNGELAAGVRDELVIFNRHLVPISRHKLKYLWVRDLIEWEDKLYFNNNGLGWLDLKSGKLTEILDAPPLRNRRLDAFCLAADRRYLLLACGDSLYKFNTQNGNTSLYSRHQLHNIKNMKWDSAHACLRLCSRDYGLYILTSKDDLLSLPLDAQRVLSRAHDMIQDQEGDFWIPGDNGLLLLKERDFRKFIESKGKKIPEYRYFGMAYGLSDNEFNGGFNQCGLRFKDSIVLANMSGAIWFHPKLKYTRAGNKLTLFLAELILDGKSTDLPRAELVLPDDYKTLRVKISYPDFSQQITSVRYRLSGNQQTEWIPLNDNEITLYSLKPGRYLLEISLSAGEKRQKIRLPIIVNQVWYLQLWAIILWLIIFSIGIFALFEWRSRGFKLWAEKEINRSRLELFGIIAHDLRSPVNSFRDVTDNISFLLKQKRYNDIEVIQDELDRANKGLQLMLENLLHWSLEQQQLITPEHRLVELRALCKTHIELYKELAGLRKIRIEQEGEDVKVLADEKSLALMLRNLLDNAIKFSEEGGIIRIRTGRKDGRAFLCIENRPSPSVKMKSLDKVIRFYRSKEHAEPGQQGLGFGVILVKQAAAKNNIEIKVDWLQAEGILRICLFHEGIPESEESL